MNYKIKIDYETDISADNKQEAVMKFFEGIESEPQQDLATFIENNLIIEEKKKGGE